MTRTTKAKATSVVLANCVSLALAGMAHAQTVQNDDARLDQLEALVRDQTRQLEGLREELAEQERSVAELQRALAEERLDDLRGLGAQSGPPAVETPVPPPGMPAAAPTVATPAVVAATGPAGQVQGRADAQQRPVGRAPAEASRPPEIAQIFEQPGVLTPRGRFVFEPSVQFGYSSNDRVALIGFTVIPAILIGLIDVRQVKTTTGTVALTGRYGITNRFELEAKVPYTHINADTVSREIFTGSAQDRVFNASGHGLGDVELTARYQLNRGGIDKPFYVGWLRYKSRTGRDLFEVVTDCVTRCISNTNATGTGLPLELPTGSGFESIQPGLTWLYASDPVVFFGSFSYLHNFKRKNVSRTVLSGAPPPNPPTTTEFIGEIEAGDIVGLNLGLGLALNEKASISLGYDQSLVGKTKQNGQDVPGSVRVMLGTLLVGGSYRFSERTSLNVALGIGVTRDTPDVSLMVRLPMSF